MRVICIPATALWRLLSTGEDEGIQNHEGHRVTVCFLFNRPRQRAVLSYELSSLLLSMYSMCSELPERILGITR